MNPWVVAIGTVLKRGGAGLQGAMGQDASAGSWDTSGLGGEEEEVLEPKQAEKKSGLKLSEVSLQDTYGGNLQREMPAYEAPPPQMGDFNSEDEMRRKALQNISYG